MSKGISIPDSNWDDSLEDFKFSFVCPICKEETHELTIMHDWSSCTECFFEYYPDRRK